MTYNPEELPIDHLLRNTPLGQLDIQRRNLMCKTWASVARWKIAKCTFNELRGPWRVHNEWRVTDERE